MSSLLGTLGVKLTAYTAAFEKRMTEAQARLEGIGDAARRISIASTAAFAAGSYGLLKLVDAASDANESMNVVQTAFGSGAQAAVEWSKTTAAVVGRSEQQLLDFAAGTQAMLAPMLGSAEAADGMSKSIAQLAVDIGSFFNVADADALLAIKAGLIGSSEPMRRFGVVMTDATLNAYAMSKGISTAFKDLDEGTKVALRYSFIMDKTTLAQGDAAKTAESYANVVKAVQGAAADLARDLGQALLPAFTAIAMAVRDALKWLKELSPETKSFIAKAGLAATAIAGVVAVLTAMLALLPSIAGGLSMVAGAAPAVGAALAGAFWPVTVAIAAVIAVIATVVFWTGVLKKAWEQNLGGIRTIVHSVANDIKDAWTWLVDKLAYAWNWWADLAKKVLEKITGWFEDQVNVWVGLARELGKALDIESLAGLQDFKVEFLLEGEKEAGIEIADRIWTGIKKTGTFVADAMGEGANYWKGVLGDLFGDFGESVDQLTGAASGAAPPAMPGLSGAGGGGTGTTASDDVPGSSIGGDLIEAGASIEQQLIDAGWDAANSLGEGARVLVDIIRGAMSGGEVGAITAAVVAALQTTETFGRIMEIFNKLLARAGKALEPALATVEPLIEAAAKLFAALLNIAIRLNPVWALLITVAPLIEGFADGLMRVINAFVSGWNWVVRQIAWVLSQIPAVGDDLADAVNQLQIDMATGTNEAFAQLGDNSWGAAEGLGGLDNQLRDINEELANVPEGFKVAAERFKAMDPASGSGPFALSDMAGGTGQHIGTLIENVVIQAMNPDEAWEGLRDAAERDNFLGSGTIIGAVGRLSTDGKGA